MRSVVEADNRLCGLSHGIAYGENDGEEIARYGKCGDALFTEHRDEHIIAGEHHNAHCQFGQEGGESDFSHVSGVAQGEQQGCQGHFQPVEFQLDGEFQEISHNHKSADNAGDRGRQCRTHNAPAQREYHIPVESDVEYCRYDLYRHGVFRRTVEPDEHHTHAFDEQEKQAGEQPKQVVDGIFFQLGTASQCVGDLLGKQDASDANQSGKQ